MNPRSIPHNDPRLTWLGAISLETTDRYTAPWRLPFDRQRLFHSTGLLERAAAGAGVRIAFETDSRTVAGLIDTPAPEMGPIDLCIDNEFIASVPMKGNEAFRFEDLPAGSKRIELWLPQSTVLRLRELQLDGDSSLQRITDTRPRWITHGSSITQCGGARSPAFTWPAIVARERNLNLTCMGFSGQCKLDAMVARVIRDTPADYISLCLGINVHGSGYDLRTFTPAVIGFIQIVREKHPTTPLAVISPILSPPREEKTAAPMSLPEMRSEIAGAVEIIQSYGDRNLFYVDGSTLLGEADVHLMPDKLHPNAEGYALLGQRFLEHVAPILFDGARR